MAIPGLANESITWYNQPLDGNDIFAGASLIIFAIIFLPLHALVAYVMLLDDRNIIGFRYLLSSIVADVLLLLNFGMIPGILILTKSQIIIPQARHWIQMYLDWVWFSMCYHHPLISWSRFAAVRHPQSFRIQPRYISYSICAGCYILALIQVLCTHFQSWYVTFYYEPSVYGMLSEDIEKYLHNGQYLFFFIFHCLVVIISIFFYAWTVLLLIKHENSIGISQCKITTSNRLNSRSRIEVRLILPCICNVVVFVVGQVLITISIGERRWAVWLVMVVFSANSAINPLLLISFSTLIRRRILRLIGVPITSVRYTPVPPCNNFATPSPTTDQRVHSALETRSKASSSFLLIAPTFPSVHIASTISGFS